MRIVVSSGVFCAMAYANSAQVHGNLMHRYVKVSE